MSENFTAVEYAPLVAEHYDQEHHHRADIVDDTKNTLEENETTALDTNAETLATILPITNETQSTLVKIQTKNKLQRNATVSQEQLKLRAAINSSSPSAIANNNTFEEKQHKPDAPMLNYIFDSHLANKHRHYDPRYVLTESKDIFKW